MKYVWIIGGAWMILKSCLFLYAGMAGHIQGFNYWHAALLLFIVLVFGWFVHSVATEPVKG